MFPKRFCAGVIWRVLAGALAVLALVCGAVAAQAQSPTTPPSPASTNRESLDDAWWTGPLLAPNASTLPRGHLLLEPYLFDVTTQGAYDAHGDRHSAPHSNEIGSLTYINYGLVDKLSVGLIPTAFYTVPSHGESSAGASFGDLTAQAQYRLTQFREGHLLPTVSFNIQETFPTAQYDRLPRASDGNGAGVYTSTLGLYSQTYFWLPNGRILRTRFNVEYALSTSASVRDASVYGTADGFRGQAQPGDTFLANAAWEYSVTRNWVLALDAIYHHAANTRTTGTRVSGRDVATPGSSILVDSGPSAYFGFAPAVEYNFNSRVGVIAGMRIIGPGRNTAMTLTPAVAVNYVH